MDTAPASSLDQVLRAFRSEHGVYLISASSRAFGGPGVGDEEEYAAQFQVDDAFVADERAGLLGMLAAVDADQRGPALEIGCGTGIFSRALVRSGAYPEYLVTDASLEFVRRARTYVTLPSGTLPPLEERRVRYGMLLDDGLRALPEASFSLVVLRYVLHHILDWQAFVGDAARVLRPGGVLAFEEPCLEGFLIQALLANTLGRRIMVDGALADPGRASGLRYRLGRLRRFLGIRTRAENAATHELVGQLHRFVEVIDRYARRNVDKSADEDKHLFRPEEVERSARAHGLEMRFFPNAGFESIAKPRSYASFEHEFFHNLRVNFGFGEGLVDVARWELAPQFELLKSVMDGGGGPHTKGVFALRRAT